MFFLGVFYLFYGILGLVAWMSQGSGFGLLAGVVLVGWGLLHIKVFGPETNYSPRNDRMRM